MTSQFCGHARATRVTRVLSLNADRVAAAADDAPARALLASRDGTCLIAGGDDGVVRVRMLHSLALLRTFDLRECGHPDCGVSALQFSRKGHELFVGTDAGGLLVVTDPRLGLLQLDASLHQTFVGL